MHVDGLYEYMNVCVWVCVNKNGGQLQVQCDHCLGTLFQVEVVEGVGSWWWRRCCKCF